MSLNGGQASGSYFFTKNLGATGEFAAYTDTIESALIIDSQAYLFGPTGRVKVTPRVSLSAHQLFGTTHFAFKPTAAEECTSNCQITTNSLTLVSGGGVDIKLCNHFSIRPVQMEYFTQQLNISDFESEAAAKRSAAVTPMTKASVGSPKYSTNGFRYSAGAVVHF
jgi:hypothetical protein